MTYKQNLETSLRRWRAFWRGEVADRPPMVVHFREEAAEGAPLDRQNPTIEDFEAQFDHAQVIERTRAAEARFARRALYRSNEGRGVHPFTKNDTGQMSRPAGAV